MRRASQRRLKPIWTHRMHLAMLSWKMTSSRIKMDRVKSQLWMREVRKGGDLYFLQKMLQSKQISGAALLDPTYHLVTRHNLSVWMLMVSIQSPQCLYRTRDDLQETLTSFRRMLLESLPPFKSSNQNPSHNHSQSQVLFTSMSMVARESGLFL